jgi:hypothetical protein
VTGPTHSYLLRCIYVVCIGCTSEIVRVIESSRTQPEEEDGRGNQAGPDSRSHPALAGPRSPSVTLSPLAHHVDVELGPTQHGPDRHSGRYARRDLRPSRVGRARRAADAPQLTTASPCPRLLSFPPACFLFFFLACPKMLSSRIFVYSALRTADKALATSSRAGALAAVRACAGAVYLNCIHTKDVSVHTCYF